MSTLPDKFDPAIAPGDITPEICEDCNKPIIGKAHHIETEGVSIWYMTVCTDCLDNYYACPRCGVMIWEPNGFHRSKLCDTCD